MTTVVNLSDFRRRPRETAAPPGNGATIHLFLGVRYERHDDAVPRAVQPATKTPGPRGGRRKRA